jgi:hypothetical protein
MVRSLPVSATQSRGERRKIHIRGGTELRTQIGAKCKKVLRTFDFVHSIGDGEKLLVFGKHGLAEHGGVCEIHQKVGGVCDGGGQIGVRRYCKESDRQG